MFAVIYHGYLKQGREADYKEAWNTVARYFIAYRGALGSSLHVTTDGLWVAYSRWPDRETRDASWPKDNDPSEEFPQEIRAAILILKDCLDQSQLIPEICMEVVEDLLCTQKTALKQHA